MPVTVQLSQSSESSGVIPRSPSPRDMKFYHPAAPVMMPVTPELPLPGLFPTVHGIPFSAEKTPHTLPCTSSKDHTAVPLQASSGLQVLVPCYHSLQCARLRDVYERENQPGMMVHICNLSMVGGWVRQESCNFQHRLGNNLAA